MIPEEAMKVVREVMKRGKSLRNALYSYNLPSRRLRFVRKLAFETIKRRNEIEYRLKYVGVRRNFFKYAVQLTARFLGVIEKGPKPVEQAYALELSEIASGILLESLQYWHPVWMIKLFKSLLGSEAYDLMKANNEPSPIRFRVNRLKGDNSVIETLIAQGIDVYEDIEFPGVYYTHDRKIFETKERKNRLIIAQDKASQAVLRLFNGGSILDACAAPGTKTQGLCEIASDVVAMDMDIERTLHMRRLMMLYGAKPHIVLGDAMHADKLFAKVFDEALVDAPCSNLGSIRDIPEIKRHLRPSKIKVLPKVQRAILSSVSRIARRIVYSTCTITREENEQVVAAVAEREGLNVITPYENRRGFGIGSRFRPHKDNTHGFFIAILEKS